MSPIKIPYRRDSVFAVTRQYLGTLTSSIAENPKVPRLRRIAEKRQFCFRSG